MAHHSCGRGVARMRTKTIADMALAKIYGFDPVDRALATTANLTIGFSPGRAVAFMCRFYGCVAVARGSGMCGRGVRVGRGVSARGRPGTGTGARVGAGGGVNPRTTGPGVSTSDCPGPKLTGGLAVTSDREGDRPMLTVHVAPPMLVK